MLIPSLPEIECAALEVMTGTMTYTHEYTQENCGIDPHLGISEKRNRVVDELLAIGSSHERCATLTRPNDPYGKRQLVSGIAVGTEQWDKF